MKRLSFLFLLLATCAQAAHVQFNFADFTTAGASLTNKRVNITPLSTPRIEGAMVITSDRLTFTTDADASGIVSNMVHGNYRVEIPGPFTITPFTILVPDTNTLLNATGLITSTITVPAATVGYTRAQTDALLTNSLHVAAGSNVVVVTNIVGGQRVFEVSATASGSGGGASTGVILGTGSPEGFVQAFAGQLYYDVTAGAMYQKVSGEEETGWSLLYVTGHEPFVGALGEGGTGVTIGSGSPEGSVEEDPGAQFWDASGLAMWLKLSGEETTGWILLFSL